jgi:hypothetical protein
MAVMSVPAIRFRPLAESDLPDLVEWFAEPEIAKWWNQPAEIDSVRAKYLPRIEQREPTQMWIAEIDDAAAATHGWAMTTNSRRGRSGASRTSSIVNPLTLSDPVTSSRSRNRSVECDVTTSPLSRNRNV